MSVSQKARFERERAERADGKILSDEHIARMHQARRDKGYFVTEKTREKMRVAARNKGPVSDETREKLRQANFNRVYPPMTQAQKDKIGAVHRGRKLSDAHRQAISDGNLRRWERWRAGG